MKRHIYAVILSLLVFAVFVSVFKTITMEAANRVLTASEVRNIIDAPGKHSFIATGVTRSLYKGKPLSVRIRQFHKKPDRCRIEYLSNPLSGVVVCNKDRSMWRYDPKLNKTVIMERSSCDGSGNRMDLLQKNYRLEESGKTVVAGKDALVIDVRNKTGRLTKRLWIDRKLHIILRTHNYDSSGNMQSSTEFDSIKYTEKIPDTIFVKPGNPPAEVCMKSKLAVSSAAELSKKIGFRVVIPSYVPSGYKIDGYRLYECMHKAGHKSAYIRYTNGLKSISIFEARGDVNCGMNGACMNKGANGCMMGKSLTGNSAQISVNGVSVSVIADLNKSDIERVAESLR